MQKVSHDWEDREEVLDEIHQVLLVIVYILFASSCIYCSFCHEKTIAAGVGGRRYMCKTFFLRKVSEETLANDCEDGVFCGLVSVGK